MIARAFAIGLAGTLALGLAASCSDEPTAEPCTKIPAGGCPLSRGVACEDPACEAVYKCRPGNVWELDRRCPAREAAAYDASAPDAEGDAPPWDANVDAPPGAFGGPGCAALQPPDCSLGLALSCPNPDCCGCEELFVCQGGGWVSWGTCGDGGPVPRP